MTLKNRNSLIVLLILAVPLAIFLGSVLYNASNLPPPAPLPNPNGYDGLIHSTTLLASNVGDYVTLNEADLQLLVSKDTDALTEARKALQEPSSVPLDYSPTSTNTMDRLAGLKRLAFAFAAEGHLANMKGRTDQAVQSYLDLIHLGNESCRGGVLIDQLVGSTIENLGIENLQKIAPQLDSKTCVATAAALETFDSQRQTWDEVMQQEHDWSRRAFPGVRNEFARITERPILTKMYRNAERKFEEQQMSMRQFIIDLAARAYELDHGHAPASAADLVPGYLKTIPQDPFTGANLTYSSRQKNH